MKNVVFAVNDGYVRQLCVAITSILSNNKDIHFYVMSSDLSQESKGKILHILQNRHDINVDFIKIEPKTFQNLKLNIDYISVETYFRYIIADILPQIDKCLYLDADIVVNGNLDKFYDTDLGENYCAGVKDAYIELINHKATIDFKPEDLYINAGVLLLNLNQMRKDKISEKLIQNTKDLSNKIQFQDQDIINITFKGRMIPCDSIYNFTSQNVIDERQKRNKACIIHYTGKCKPWHKDCHNKLKSVWKKYAKKAEKIMKQKIKVALLIDEFFGGAGTAFGGYGALARKYIAKYIPCENISIDVLLGAGGHRFRPRKYHVDDVNLYRLPRKHWASRLFLKRKNYDIYLSIELTTDWVLRHETNNKKKLILWIQDPRPKTAWENTIDTMQSIKDPCFYVQHVYDTVNKLYKENRVKFISQGYCLNPLAKELYQLPENTPIQYLPNPIEMDLNFKFDITKKKKQVIFLGRLEAQKRCWLFCEVAKRMPEYEFYVLGQFFRYQDDNRRMLAPYMDANIKNLHFIGHVDGEKKKKFIQESRILLSTAIWEGIPISWLEALSYGTLIVSDLERENLASKFGKFVGEIHGDGFDGVDMFIPAIKELMEDDALYEKKATDAIKYIRETHNIPRFINDLRTVIYKEMQQ